MPPRLLIHRTGGLGDTLCLAPLVRAARDAGYRVTGCGDPQRWGLLAREGVHDVLSPEALFPADFLARPGPSGPVPEGFDRVLFLARCGAGPTPPNRAFGLWPPWPPPGVNVYDYSAHVAERSLGRRPPSWTPPPPPGLGTILAPGAGSPRKRLDPERFLERFQDADPPVRCVLGPAEPPAWDARLRAAGLAVLRPELPALPGVLSEAASMIAHDSGPAHLAALLGLRTRIVYVSTDPAVWRPPGRVTVLS